MVCKRCRGNGHDRKSRPVVEFVPFIDEHGKHRKRHVTKSLGSGCLLCLGRVVDSDISVPLAGTA